MYELMDGVISLLAGIYCYLAAVGKIQISSNEVKAEQWRDKFGTIMKITSPVLIIFGLFRLSSVLL